MELEYTLYSISMVKNEQKEIVMELSLTNNAREDEFLADRTKA